MSDSGDSHIETLEIEQRKLSRHSTGHNISHAGQIQAPNISRRSKINNGSSREIQMVITLNKWMSNSGAKYIKMVEIEQRKLSRISNGRNF